MSLIAAAIFALTLQSATEANVTIGNDAYSEERVDRSLEEFAFVPASPERIEAYVRSMFDRMDSDGSGFIEQAEAPERLAAMRQGSPRGYDPANVAEAFEGQAAQTEYISVVDKDGDGRVSYEEYATPTRPQYLARGIPLTPADW